MPAKIVEFHYRSQIEVPRLTRKGRPSFVWRDGFSETGEGGGVVYPWRTRSAIRAECKSAGVTPAFVQRLDEAS